MRRSVRRCKLKYRGKSWKQFNHWSWITAMKMSRNLWIQMMTMNLFCSTTRFIARRATSLVKSFQIVRSRSASRTRRIAAVMRAIRGTKILPVYPRSASMLMTASQTVSYPTLKSLAPARALATGAEAVIRAWHSTRKSTLTKANRTKTSYVCPTRWGERPCMIISCKWTRKNLLRIGVKKTRAIITSATVAIALQWAPWELTILRILLTQ